MTDEIPPVAKTQDSKTFTSPEYEDKNKRRMVAKSYFKTKHKDETKGQLVDKFA